MLSAGYRFWVFGGKGWEGDGGFKDGQSGRDEGLKVGRSVLDILIGLKGNCKSFLGIIMYAWTKGE